MNAPVELAISQHELANDRLEKAAANADADALAEAWSTVRDAKKLAAEINDPWMASFFADIADEVTAIESGASKDNLPRVCGRFIKALERYVAGLE